MSLLRLVLQAMCTRMGAGISRQVQQVKRMGTRGPTCRAGGRGGVWNSGKAGALLMAYLSPS